MSKSKGHVGIIGRYEYFHGPDGCLYLANLSSPLDVNGYRLGGEFECMPRPDGHAEHMAHIRRMVAQSRAEEARADA